MKLDVCICTHNPRPEIFKVILTALAHQSLSKDAYQVWVIDKSFPYDSKSDRWRIPSFGNCEDAGSSLKKLLKLVDLTKRSICY